MIEVRLKPDTTYEFTYEAKTYELKMYYEAKMYVVSAFRRTVGPTTSASA